jgi:hypothetical protein
MVVVTAAVLHVCGGEMIEGREKIEGGFRHRFGLELGRIRSGLDAGAEGWALAAAAMLCRARMQP